MKLKINYDRIGVAITAGGLTGNFGFIDIDSISPIPSVEYKGLSLSFNSTLNRWTAIIFNANQEIIASYTGNDIPSNLGNNATFVCNIATNTLNNLLKLERNGFIDLAVEGVTNVLTYRLNDQRNKLDKNLTVVGVLEGSFKSPIGIKNIELDVLNYDLSASYNYVYIPKLKRCYYVTNIQFTTKDYVRIILQEDVLMSHIDLIKSQKAFITRWGGATDSTLVDERYPLKDKPTITTYSPSNVSGATTYNFKYVMAADPITEIKNPNILVNVATTTQELTTTTDDISAPSGTSLPAIQSKRDSNHQYRFMNFSEFGGLVSACLKDDATASFIVSAMLVPFSLLDLFTDNPNKDMALYVGNKALLGDSFVSLPYSGDLTKFYGTKKGGSPYIIVKDFYFNSSGGITVSDSWLNHSPNSEWEIYLPFVGWITLDFKQVYGKRIMVYYTFDFETGVSTAYIYNRTDNIIIWSGSCQIGIKLPLALTNALENTKAKQNNALNLIMGLMSSAVGITGSAYEGKTGGIASGIGNIGKSIVSAVNTNNMIIDRAQINFGASDNAFYAPNQVIIRQTKHDPILGSDDEATFLKLNGKPYKNYVAISSLENANNDYYFEVGEVQFDPKGNNIYSVEIDEIVALLKTGVII